MAPFTHSCPAHVRTTPKGPSLRVLEYLHFKNTGRQLKPCLSKNYYDKTPLYMDELQAHLRPEQQAICDDMYDAIRAYLLKVTKITSAAALVQLTAGIVQLISSAVAMRHSHTWETALHVTSIVTAILSIVTAIIQGISVPLEVSATLETLKASIGDMCEAVGDHVASLLTKPSDATTLAARSMSQEVLPTLQTLDPVPVSIPQKLENTESAASAESPIEDSLLEPIAPLELMAPLDEEVTTSATDDDDVSPTTGYHPIDQFPRTNVGFHACGSNCTPGIALNADTPGAKPVQWYKTDTYDDWVPRLFAPGSIPVLSAIFPDTTSLFNVTGHISCVSNPAFVTGCNKNTIYFHQDDSGTYIGVTDDFLTRPVGPGAYLSGLDTDKPKLNRTSWSCGVQGIYHVEGSLRFDLELLERWPYLCAYPWKGSSKLSPNSTINRLQRATNDSFNNLRALIDSAPDGGWISNCAIRHSSARDYPAPAMFLLPEYKFRDLDKYIKNGGAIIEPLISQNQSTGDWSKLVLCLLSVTLCAIGMGQSPGRHDFTKWIAAFNQAGLATKNLAQAQDFITSQLLGLDLDRDDELEKRFNTLCEDADHMLAIPASVFVMRPDLVQRHEAWVTSFRSFMRESKDSKSKAVPWYMRTLNFKDNRLSELWTQINQCFHESKERTPTVLVELVGKPGIGKTTAITQYFIPELAKRMGGINTDCYQLHITHNGHFSVYSGQTFARYDEFRARGAADPMFQYINQIASCSPFQVPSAFVKDRNLTSQIMFLTSNSGATALGELYTREAEIAVNSRIHQYRVEHPEAERLMALTRSRDVVCARGPETFNYYRRTLREDARWEEVQITYETFMQDLYILMWQQYNAHPPCALDDTIKTHIEQWTGVKDVKFEDKWIMPRVTPMINDAIPPLKKMPTIQTVPTPANSAQGPTPSVPVPQAGNDHYVVHLHGQSGRGKTHFMNTLTRRFPSLMRTHIHPVDLTNRASWGQHSAYWIDDQLIANQEAYHDFYNTRDAPSVIFITSNIRIEPRKPGLLQRTAAWWAGASHGRVCPEIHVEGLRRRMGLDGTIALHHDDATHAFTPAGTNTEGNMIQPGLVLVNDKQYNVNSFLMELGHRLRTWRHANIIVEWKAPDGISVPVDPDIKITAKDWTELKMMLRSASSMWKGYGTKPGCAVYIKPSLATQLRSRDDIAVDFWTIHESSTKDDLDDIVASIFTLYREVDLQSTLVVSVGDQVYWNHEHILYRRVHSKLHMDYEVCGDNVTLKFLENKPTGLDKIAELTIAKKELVCGLCEGIIHSEKLLFLSPDCAAALLTRSDEILGNPLFTAVVEEHYSWIHGHWKSSVIDGLRERIATLWKEHPFFAIASTVILLIMVWKGVTGLYSKMKTLITGVTTKRCPKCNFLHQFDRQDTRMFNNSEAFLCPICLFSHAHTPAGERGDFALKQDAATKWRMRHWDTDKLCYSQSETLEDMPAMPAVTSVTSKQVKVRLQRLKTSLPPGYEIVSKKAQQQPWDEDWKDDSGDWADLQKGQNDHLLKVIPVVRSQMCTLHGSGKTRGLFIGGKYVVGPAHMCEGENVVIEYHDRYYDAQLIYENKSSDLAMFYVLDKTFPMQRDLTKYMIPASRLQEVGAGVLVLDRPTGYDALHGKMDIEANSVGYVASDYTIRNENVVTLRSMSIAMGGIAPQNGDCGNAYFCNNGTAQCLVGIHISFNAISSKAHGSALIREQIKAIIDEHSCNQLQDVRDVHVHGLPMGTYHAEKSSHQYFTQYIDKKAGRVKVPPNRCVVLGKCPKSLHKAKGNRYKLSPYSDRIEHLLPCLKIPVDSSMAMVTDFSQMLRDNNGQYCQLTTQMANCDRVFSGDPELLDRAEEIVLDYMRMYYGSNHRTLNQKEVLNGTPGLHAVKLTTGAGPVLNRMHGVSLKGECFAEFSGVKQFARTTAGEYSRERYKQETALFHEGKTPLYICQAQLKTECLMKDKAEKGKIRLFVVGELHSLLQERRLSGQIAASIANTIGPIAIGKDPLTYFDTYFSTFPAVTHHVDIDVKRWDKNLPPAVMARTLRVLANMHGTDVEHEYQALFRFLAFPIVQLDDTLVQIMGSMPSGVFHTALGGSVAHYIILTYALLKALPEGEHPYRDATAILCGDDASYVHNDKKIDLEKLTQGYLECAMTVQNPEKDGGPLQNRPLAVPVQFCSREIYYDDGHWIPCLRSGSMASPLHYTRERSTAGFQRILYMMEAESYGLPRVRYENFRLALQTAWKFLGDPSYAAQIPHFNEARRRVIMFIKGVYTSRGDMVGCCSTSEARLIKFDCSLPEFSEIYTLQMAGVNHPRTAYIQTCEQQHIPPRFEETVVASRGGFSCLLVIEGESYRHVSSKYVDVTRGAWDAYQKTLAPAPAITPVVAVPSGPEHPKSKFYQRLARNAELECPTIECRAMPNGGWTCTISNSRETIERTSNTKKMAEYLAWERFLECSSIYSHCDGPQREFLGELQMDEPRIPGTAMPIADSKGTEGALLDTGALGVPQEWIAHSGTVTDIIDIARRTLWSPSTSVSSSDTPNTIIVNVGWADCANWGITELAKLHRNMSGKVYVTIQISGGTSATGFVRAGVLLEDIATPTVSDLEQVKNCTLAVNESQTMTFALPFIGKTPYQSTDALPTVPRVIVMTESVITNQFGSTTPIAVIRSGWDADHRVATPTGDFIPTNTGLSLSFSGPRPSTSSPAASVSGGAGLTVGSYFPDMGLGDVYLCTDGRTYYDSNSVNILKAVSLGEMGHYCDHLAAPWVSEIVSGNAITHMPSGALPLTFQGVGNWTTVDSLGYDNFWYDFKDSRKVSAKAYWFSGSFPVSTNTKEWPNNGIASVDIGGLSEFGLPILDGYTDHITDQTLCKFYWDYDYENVTEEKCKIWLGGKLEAANTDVNYVDVDATRRVAFHHGSVYIMYELEQSAWEMAGASDDLNFLNGEIIAVFPDTTTDAQLVCSTSAAKMRGKIAMAASISEIPIAVASQGRNPKTLPPGWCLARMTCNTPNLVQNPTGAQFQPSLYADHVLKSALIKHANAVDGDTLHFQLINRRFSQAVTAIRLVVMDTVAASYFCCRASDPYAWYGSVQDMLITNLIKVEPSAMLQVTDQSGWASLLTTSRQSLAGALRQPQPKSRSELAAALVESPDFLRLAHRFMYGGVLQMEPAEEWSQRGTRPKSPTTKREAIREHLGDYVDPRRVETDARKTVTDLYYRYKAAKPDPQMIAVLHSTRYDVELPMHAQRFLREMQLYLRVKGEKFDSRMGNNKWQIHIANTLTTISTQLNQLLMLSKEQATVTPRPSMGELQAARPSMGVDQAEIAMLAAGSAMQGLGSAAGGIAGYLQQKRQNAFAEKMNATNWANATNMTKLQGGIGMEATRRAQAQRFSQQMSLMGAHGAQNLQLARFNKTGSTEAPNTDTTRTVGIQPTADTGSQHTAVSTQSSTAGGGTSGDDETFTANVVAGPGVRTAEMRGPEAPDPTSMV